MTRFFCFHTGQEYGPMAQTCADSFAKFNVEITLIQLDSKKDWMKNCMQRSLELKRLAEEYPEDSIGLLDSDLTCMQYPELLVNFKGDLAVHDLTDTQPGKIHPSYRYSAGVTVFGPTKRGRDLLTRWSDLCRLDPHKGEMLREQVYLYLAIHGGNLEKFNAPNMVDGVVVTNIGERYNRTIDRFKEGDDTVILHHVASRELRSKIGGRM